MKNEHMIRAEIESRLGFERAIHRDTLNQLGFRFTDEHDFVQEHGKNVDTCIRLAAILLEYAVDLRKATPKHFTDEQNGGKA
jgi:hypothetical protein